MVWNNISTRSADFALLISGVTEELLPCLSPQGRLKITCTVPLFAVHNLTFFLPFFACSLTDW